MISHKHQCIFIHIPKCAGTSIEKVLGHFDGFTGENGAQDHRALRMLKTPNFSLNCLSNIDNIKTYLRGVKYHHRQLANPKNRIRVTAEQYDQYFKFAIVRNPWSRAYSWYKNVIRDADHLKHFGISADIKFNDFLFKYVGQGMLRPQVYWLKDYKGNLPYDYIGKFEKLPSVLEELRNHLGLGDIKFPHEISGSGEDYRAQYNQASINLIKAVCKEDIKYFGYTFEN